MRQKKNQEGKKPPHRVRNDIGRVIAFKIIDFIEKEFFIHETIRT